MDYFRMHKITERVIRINDITHSYMYLVLGNEHHLLIDTGAGVGNLKQYLVQQGFDPSKITVALTHGHVDHVGGASAFSKVYLSSLDWDLYQEHVDLEARKYFTAHVLGEDYPLDELDFMEPAPIEFRDLKDQQMFHLGGLDVMAIAVPGHTQGFMCFLILQEKMMLLGDACNKSVFLFFPESTTVSDYQKSLIYLDSYKDYFTRCLISHGSGRTSISSVDTCISACKSILEGKDDAIPFYFMGYDAKMAYPADDKFNRYDGIDGNIMYSPRKIKNYKEDA